MCSTATEYADGFVLRTMMTLILEYMVGKQKTMVSCSGWRKATLVSGFLRNILLPICGKTVIWRQHLLMILFFMREPAML